MCGCVCVCVWDVSGIDHIIVILRASLATKSSVMVSYIPHKK